MGSRLLLLLGFLAVSAHSTVLIAPIVSYKAGKPFRGEVFNWWNDVAAVGVGLVVIAAVIFAIPPIVRLLRKGG